jgi:hypothetical protein
MSMFERIGTVFMLTLCAPASMAWAKGPAEEAPLATDALAGTDGAALSATDCTNARNYAYQAQFYQTTALSFAQRDYQNYPNYSIVQDEYRYTLAGQTGAVAVYQAMLNGNYASAYSQLPGVMNAMAIGGPFGLASGTTDGQNTYAYENYALSLENSAYSAVKRCLGK